jgi:hypothetical protein
MTVFRCTQRLAKRLRVPLADDALPSSGSLGDWYANVLNVGHSRHVLCLSERTLLPVILPARKSEFPDRFPRYLEAVLRHLDISGRHIECELRETREPVFAKTRSRPLLGSLNDFIFSASVFLERGDSPLEANLALAEMPSKVIGFAFPSEAARDALDSWSAR